MIDPSISEMQRPQPTVDASQPTTLLQVKLADGKKIRVKYVNAPTSTNNTFAFSGTYDYIFFNDARLNKSHTVLDLIAMIYHR